MTVKAIFSPYPAPTSAKYTSTLFQGERTKMGYASIDKN